MPKYYELVIEGDFREVRFFVEGLLAGREEPGKAVFLNEINSSSDSLIEKLKKLAHLKDNHAHVIVEEKLFDTIQKAIEKSRALGMTLHHASEVARARFEFSFECFSTEHGAVIKEIFENLPEGISLSEDSRIQENQDPEAKGIEMYSPTHHYELKGEGIVSGPVMEIFEVYLKAGTEPLIELGTLELEQEL